jgi:hypothetical protein
MSYTKRQFVQAAFNEIGLESYEFDLQPEDFDMALRRLDSMIAEWNAQGIRVGYPIPTSPEDSDLDEETGVQDAANEAIITNLAIKVAPAFGKTPAVETKISASKAYKTLLSKTMQVPKQQMPSTMPSGAGNRPWNGVYRPFLYPPCDPIEAGKDSIIEF